MNPRDDRGYRVALITGASSGLGRALALALAGRGTHVIAAARRRERLDELVTEISAAGGTAEALLLDCAQVDLTYRVVRDLDAGRPLDLVVANAGFSAPTPARTLSWPVTKTILELNVLGAAATLAGALPGMVERNSGHLVGIASIAGFRGLPRHSAYCASKAALITLCESLRVDLRSTRVAVTAISPGFVRTELTARNKFPMPFLMEPEDAARVMLRAIDRRSATCVFPRPMAILMRSLQFVPRPFYDRLAARMRAGTSP